MTITTKELMLISDNIKMAQNSVKVLEGCAELSTDQQVKSLCQQMARDHQGDVQVLMKHVSASGATNSAPSASSSINNGASSNSNSR